MVPSQVVQVIAENIRLGDFILASENQEGWKKVTKISRMGQYLVVLAEEYETIRHPRESVVVRRWLNDCSGL